MLESSKNSKISFKFLQVKKEKVEEGSSNSPDVKTTLSAMENNINFLMSLVRNRFPFIQNVLRWNFDSTWNSTAFHCYQHF